MKFFIGNGGIGRVPLAGFSQKDKLESLRSSEHAWNKVRLFSNVHTGRPLKSIPVQKDAVHLNVEPTKEIAELPQEEDALVKALSNFMFENEAQHFKSVTISMLLVVLLFSVVYCMLKPKCKEGEECIHPGLPGGTVFDLLEVLICGIVGGKIVARFGLLPLFGQLLMGFLLKNVIPDQVNGFLQVFGIGGICE